MSLAATARKGMMLNSSVLFYLGRWAGRLNPIGL